MDFILCFLCAYVVPETNSFFNEETDYDSKLFKQPLLFKSAGK